MNEGRSEGSGPSATERAEEQLNRWGQTLGRVASMVGMRVARVAAFAREEAEDMWAEAQDMRHRQISDGAESSEGSGASQREGGEQKAESKQDAEPGGEIKTGAYAGAAGRKKEEPEAASERSAEN